MKGVTVKALDNGAQVMWAVPTGGCGHAADEQPLPYVRYKGRSLTPRYGADESFIEAGYESLPLPSFQLIDGWPLSQKIFNLFRRRVNIYWRNLFATVCRSDNRFLFAQQLSYKQIDNGFFGFSPVVNHIRQFKLIENQIEVSDVIEIKTKIKVHDIVVSNGFVENGYLVCRQRPELKALLRELSSSTGGAQVFDMYADPSIVRKGLQLRAQHVYEVLSAAT